MALPVVPIRAALPDRESSRLNPVPAHPRAGRVLRGIYRITRHPLMMAFVVFGLAHLLPNGSTADVAFFGGFVLFSLVGAWHQDARKLATGVPGFREFVAGTPFVPFTGRATGQGLRELSPVIVGLGIAATVLVRWFHPVWFGG